MMKFWSCLLLLGAMVTTAVAQTGKDIFKNKCITCHGNFGLNLDAPLLHGQSKIFLMNELKNLRSGKRKDLIFNGMMNKVAAKLSDEKIDKVTTYLSQANPCDINIEVYPERGNVEDGAATSAMCKGCHFKNSPLNAPILDGQKTYYTVRSLLAFKADKRSSMFMAGISKGLTAKNIDDLSAYWNSLRSCP